MTTVQILDEVTPEGKVYTETMIGMAAFFGGPLAAAYLLVENYKTLGQTEKVTKTWVLAALGAVLMIVAQYILTQITGFSVIGLAILAMAVARQVYQKEQDKAVINHIGKGGALQSAWRAAGMSLLIWGITVVISIGPMLMVFPSFEPSVEEVVESPTIASTITMDIQTKSYGEAAHVIVYDGAFLQEEMVDAIANALTGTNLFNENQKIVTIERGDLDSYIFSIEDPAADLMATTTKTLYSTSQEALQALFPTRNVEILLIDGTTSEVLARY